jgi:hypothetical protein
MNEEWSEYDAICLNTVLLCAVIVIQIIILIAVVWF